MKYDPQKHHRRSIRLKGYDYCQPGGYYITIVTQNRACLFGDVVKGEMVLNTFGRIIAYHWQQLPVHFGHIQLDVYQIMPNHLHGIIIITDNIGAMYSEKHNRKYQNNVSGDVVDVGAKHSCEKNSNIPFDLCRNALPLHPGHHERPGRPDHHDHPGHPEHPGRPGRPDHHDRIYQNNSGGNTSPHHGPSPPRPHGTRPGSLPAIMQNFLSVTTRKINRIRKTPGQKLWQRNYWEHIIRNENDLNRIREYIGNNPGKWQSDNENPFR